jgi:hypothetical protein
MCPLSMPVFPPGMRATAYRVPPHIGGSINPHQKQRMRILAMRVLHQLRDGVDPRPMAMYDETADDCD